MYRCTDQWRLSVPIDSAAETDEECQDHQRRLEPFGSCLIAGDVLQTLRSCSGQRLRPCPLGTPRGLTLSAPAPAPALITLRTTAIIVGTFSSAMRPGARHSPKPQLHSRGNSPQNRVLQARARTVATNRACGGRAPLRAWLAVARADPYSKGSDRQFREECLPKPPPSVLGP